MQDKQFALQCRPRGERERLRTKAMLCTVNFFFLFCFLYGESKLWSYQYLFILNTRELYFVVVTMCVLFNHFWVQFFVWSF